MALFWKKIISLENNLCFHPPPVKPLNLTSSLRMAGVPKMCFIPCWDRYSARKTLRKYPKDSHKRFNLTCGKSHHRDESRAYRGVLCPLQGRHNLGHYGTSLKDMLWLGRLFFVGHAKYFSMQFDISQYNKRECLITLSG